MKYADLHLHALDQFDAQNDPEKVCARMVELGAQGFALTQHGTLAGIEPMRDACAKHGLKFVPGVETYYGNEGDLMSNQHLVLLSKDYTGYKAISMAVTDGQNKAGYSVMNDEILNRYFGLNSFGHGHVIALSACIQGPLAAELRQNEVIEREVTKLQNRFSGVSDQANRIANLEIQQTALMCELDQAKQNRDSIKKLADSKFAAREKKIAKLKEQNSPDYEMEYQQLQLDKEMANKAKADLEEKKKKVAQLTKKQTALSQELKALCKEQERYIQYHALVQEAESKKRTEEEMKKRATEKALSLKTLFGEENFLIELQYHGIDKEARIYPILASIAQQTNIPVVATNDVHITTNSEEERLRRQILRSLRFGERFEEESVGDSELYIKTDEELHLWLTKILPDNITADAIQNIRKVFDACDVIFPEGEKHYPKFPSKDGKSAEEMLDDEIEKGIKLRFPDGMDEAHQKRLKHELNIIKTMGYSDYHLIVKDFLEYGRVLACYPEDMLRFAPYTIEAAKDAAERNGWKGGLSVGPGRGSAVGSLVCYLLGITSMDPLQYDLLFERFLNPERVSMPDIDVDLSKRVRGKVIEYVQKKYGENAVCGIITTNAQAPKGAIRIAAKFYGLKLTNDGGAFASLGDQMAKMVPGAPGTAFDTIMDDGNSVYETIEASYEKNHHAKEILKWAKVVEGCFTTYGAHAAGIVISDNDDIKEYMPLRWNQKLNEWTTMCDMIKVEEKGCLKMDFLGLKTLDVITGTIEMIKKRTGRTIDPLTIPMDDESVYRTIFSEGQTNAVFQFESSGMKSMLKRFQPTTFDDIILLVAAYRPGPLQYLDGVIDVKSGKKPIEYATPELESILSVTYGYPIYQEQVMQIFQKLAGYSLGGADLVRRFMSKKKMDKLAKERETFVHGDETRNIDGCVKRGITEEIANEIFAQMTEFAKYAFNKSHAAAYAYVSYMTAWLKCHYPAEFLAEAMNWAEDDDEIKGLMRETKSFGVQVLAPDVNRSAAKYAVVDGKILYGLGSIRAVGENAAVIIEEREHGPFNSLKDFYLRVSIKKNAMENLIRAGAFDAFCRNREALVVVIEPYKKAVKKYKEKQDFVNQASILLTGIDTIASDEDLKEFQTAHGIAVLDTLTTAKKLESRIENARKAAATAMDDIESIILPSDMEEDPHARLNAEHAMLGAYVTGHPLDEYEVEEYDTTPISQVDTFTTSIFGIITEVVLKNRKSDGKPMAFLRVEDTTGEIDVSVFTNEYVSCSGYLKEGTVVKILGTVREEETGTLDENDKPMSVYKFTAKSMRTPKPSRKVTIEVSSYAVFHATKESEFRKKYEDMHGCRFYIYDKQLDQLRVMQYRVKDNATID